MQVTETVDQLRNDGCGMSFALNKLVTNTNRKGVTMKASVLIISMAVLCFSSISFANSFFGEVSEDIQETVPLTQIQETVQPVQLTRADEDNPFGGASTVFRDDGFAEYYRAGGQTNFKSFGGGYNEDGIPQTSYFVACWDSDLGDINGGCN